MKILSQIIMVRCLIHNYIHTNMEVDPLENGLDEFMNNQAPQDVLDNLEVIDSLDTSPEWTTWRDTIAHIMFNEWAARQGRRSWSKIEAIVNDGWKADNGFKVGFQRELKNGCRGFYPALILWLTQTLIQKFMSGRRTMGLCLICCLRVVLVGIPLLAPSIYWMKLYGMHKRAYNFNIIFLFIML
ncbi:hypothetical protein ACS0TY_035284 [Phlomoides rotata]